MRNLYANCTFILPALCCLLLSCSSQKQLSRSFKKEFNTNALFEQYHVGFDLYDLKTKTHVFQHNAERYFIPASNTKLYTFYAGLKISPDSIAGLRYLETPDSLIFWGTGDPSFLHSILKGDKAYNFLKQSDKKLYFSPTRYTGNFFGLGWSWDDYNDYYQAEINELPVMDNLVSVKSNSKNELEVWPKSFETCFKKDSASTSEFLVKREFTSNYFHYPNSAIPQNYQQQIPYKVNIGQTISLLSDTLHKQISTIHRAMPTYAKTIYNVSTDSVLKNMMLPSDNFIAEQLLLTYADKLGLEMNTAKVIEQITKMYLQQLPDKPRWVDGSGLSRMNLFTPRDNVKLLELIFAEFQVKEKLFQMLPAGGKTGTLKNAYPKTDTPFVFGKTGTLSNNHNQSGYVVTKKGNVYAFAFMNNNFMHTTANVRTEIAKMITQVYEKL